MLQHKISFVVVVRPSLTLRKNVAVDCTFISKKFCACALENMLAVHLIKNFTIGLNGYDKVFS